MITTNARKAQPGDIFLLLVPTAQELQLLRRRQTELHELYGGQIVKHLHITCQRFSPKRAGLERLCCDTLKSELVNYPPFMIYTDLLIQFYARYWQNHVLRWRILETDEYARFRAKVEDILAKIGCPTHFNRLRYGTCSALNLEGAVTTNLNQNEHRNPQPLFEAKTMQVSKLNQDNRFEILDTFSMVGKRK